MLRNEEWTIACISGNVTSGNTKNSLYVSAVKWTERMSLVTQFILEIANGNFRIKKINR